MHYQETSGSQEEKARETQAEGDTKFGTTEISDRLCTDWQGWTGLDLSGVKSTYHTTIRAGMC